MRPITAKVWLHPALVPSLVGGAVESISSRYRRSFIIITVNITLLSSSLVLPSQPKHVRAVEVTQSSLRLSWTPGFGGDYPVVHCSVQVRNDCVCRPKCCHCLSENGQRCHRQGFTFEKSNFQLNRAWFSSILLCFICVAPDQVSLWESGPLD